GAGPARPGGHGAVPRADARVPGGRGPPRPPRDRDPARPAARTRRRVRPLRRVLARASAHGCVEDQTIWDLARPVDLPAVAIIIAAEPHVLARRIADRGAHSRWERDPGSSAVEVEL